MKDKKFENVLNAIELSAWTAFKSVCENFLGSNRHLEYVKIVNDLLQTYKTMKCNMSLKIHFLHSHLDFFPPNLEAWLTFPSRHKNHGKINIQTNR